MNGLKEWFSDHLRYFMLGLAALLFFVLVFIGVRAWFYSGGDGQEDTIEILSEREEDSEASEEPSTEADTEASKESELQEASEAQSEERESEEESAATEANLTLAQIEPETASETETGAQGETGTQTESAALTETAAQTETSVQTEPQPVYLTMTGACYIRSAPSYDGDILATYEAGTVVEFLEDAGGWYKVRVDGMEGYMGARFFSYFKKP